MGTHGEGEEPLPQGLIGTGDTDRRQAEPFVQRVLDRDRVVADVGAEDHQAALVNEFLIGVDHRLHRSLRKTLHLSVDDLDGPVDDAFLECVAEDHVEWNGEVVAVVLRKIVRKQKVHQVADLDRFCIALVRHQFQTTFRCCGERKKVPVANGAGASGSRRSAGNRSKRVLKNSVLSRRARCMPRQT